MNAARDIISAAAAFTAFAVAVGGIAAAAGYLFSAAVIPVMMSIATYAPAAAPI